MAKSIFQLCSWDELLWRDQTDFTHIAGNVTFCIRQEMTYEYVNKIKQ